MLTEHVGWRGVLAALGVVTALMFVLALLLIPETLPLAQRHDGGLRRALSNFARLGRDRAFILLTIMVACNFGALLAYISAAPFVGQVMLGMSPAQFSLSFASGAVAMVLTNFINSRMAGRVPPTRLLFVGTTLVGLAGCAFATLALTEALSIPAFIACAFVMSGGVALVSANGTALALGLADYARGSGSALLGCIQFLGGSLTPPIVGAWGDHTAVPMATTIIVGAVCACACAVGAATVLRRRARG
ncbi:putative MFS family arabinose efflux permease [Leucobacter exalbidus]|uniref:MFS family arabinose efflux permease n=1 Tax=Leucobacter exalbidus TaxID=662960 RepID=A0A940PMA2_9MICO|nr:MFS transporter [Leucobacter exalbidus]MBP1325720.1 putative MFS family arabinose efflux permease [Leucobacter exalbidus]